MLQTNPDSQLASCPPPFGPPPHPGPTGGNKKISRRLKVCFWNSGKKHVNILWWHNQITSLCESRSPQSFSRFKEFNSDNFPEGIPSRSSGHFLPPLTNFLAKLDHSKNTNTHPTSSATPTEIYNTKDWNQKDEGNPFQKIHNIPSPTDALRGSRDTNRVKIWKCQWVTDRPTHSPSLNLKVGARDAYLSEIVSDPVLLRIYRNLLGEVQVGSLLDAVRWFGSLTDIDESRIAIWGHSFGGSLALAALTSDKVDN